MNEKNENQSKPKQKQPKPGQVFDKEQYEMLLRCSEKKDMTEWNEWRYENPKQDIWLEGTQFANCYLAEAVLNTGEYERHKPGRIEISQLPGQVYLKEAIFRGADLKKANFAEAHLEEASFVKANLEESNLAYGNLGRADLFEANLERADLTGACLAGAILRSANLKSANLENANMKAAHLGEANLEGATIEHANLENAKIALSAEDTMYPGVNVLDIIDGKTGGANMEKASLDYANLENTWLKGTCLKKCSLRGANLKGTHFETVNLKGANFTKAIVDGVTLFESCSIDEDTDFREVGLHNARIESGTKQLLEYNIRRMNWDDWYQGKSASKLIIKTRQLTTSPIRLFWWISNYGLSTWRIILTFFALATVFATVYFVCGLLDYYLLDIKDQPGIVADLFVPIVAEEPVSDAYYGTIIYFRSIYFSVVTMTTLGFGDMYANPTRPGWRWWTGHSLLILQVILGYVLLGALVTRFAVLFTAGGPAGKFPKNKENRNR